MKPQDQYKQYVDQAKEILRIAKFKKMEIAALALKVCDIQVGGKRNVDHYSIKRFAKDLNLNPKTVETWVQIKKNVYDKIEPKTVDKMNYAALLETFRKTRKNKYSNVQKTANDIINTHTDEKTFSYYLGKAYSILYFSNDMKRVSKVEKETMDNMINVCLRIISNLNKYKDLKNMKHLKLKRPILKETGAIV